MTDTPAAQTNAERVIVFVCTGNTCRSPMAEALCKRRLAEKLGCSPEELPARGYIVGSAGLAAMEGLPAAREARETVKALGADLAGHRSRMLTEELLARADHLFVMTASHAEALEGFPGAERSKLLDPSGEDVDDPIGASREVYVACAERMDRHIARWVEGMVS